MNLIACEICGLVQQSANAPSLRDLKCARCDSTIVRHHPDSRARTAALAIAAICLYVPANMYPIMVMEYMGRHTENTVWGGVQALFQDHMWYVATIVFMASILVPLLKLMGLFFLVTNRGRRWQKLRTWIYKAVCQIGPWAMLDVFLLALLVALIRFGRFATVIPGPGIIAFTSVVVLTILASSSFDPQLIWKEDKFESHKK
ncbi:MAG TPA: paraquat-inducible protein A [Verrucomicrobiae bacterium]|nr:paraquat-inducible protein A [Verrucomicrobiae bacterium]